MMVPDDRLPPLARLAALHGIGSSYVDAFGDRQNVPPETLRALLRTMDVAAGSDHDVDRALREARRSSIARPLEPVHVLRHGRPAVLPLRLPGRRAHGRLEWEVIIEQGASYHGVTLTEHLPARAIAELGDTNQGAISWRIPVPLPVGEHQIAYRFVSKEGAVEDIARLFVTPGQCFALDDLGQGRLWGITAQLYAQWSASSWGIGDFGDLRRLATIMAP